MPESIKRDPERIVVVVPWETKRWFRVACAKMDKTMSEVLRQAMEEVIRNSGLELEGRGDAETEV